MSNKYIGWMEGYTEVGKVAYENLQTRLYALHIFECGSVV